MKKLKFNFKKIISILLALVILVGILATAIPARAYAADITEKNLREIELTLATEAKTNAKAQNMMNDINYSTRASVYSLPIYNQLDYSQPYGDYGTIASHGCGIACLSMVATYLKDNWALTPTYLADVFGNYNTSRGSLWVLFEDSAKELRLGDVKRVYSWDDGVEEALRNGQLVINLQGRGLFTRGGHFIVLTGINEDGKVMVNDPYGKNWDKLEEKFKNGFEISDIRKAAEAYWIYPPKSTNVTVNGIPTYSASDYIENDENASYNEIYTSSVTALAMVATYLHNDLNATPDVLAEMFAEFSNDNTSFYGPSLNVFDNCDEILGIDGVQKVYNWNSGEVEAALENGQIVVSFQAGGLWGGRRHIVVLKKNMESGKIVAYDPLENDLNNPSLEIKMIEGFESEELAQSNFVCWIFPEKDIY